MNIEHPSNYHIIINDNIAHEFRSAGLAWDWYNSLTRGKVTDVIKLVRDGVVIAANDRKRNLDTETSAGLDRLAEFIENNRDKDAVYINPDCAVGKHHACNGDAWDKNRDQATTCACSCHKEVN